MLQVGTCFMRAFVPLTAFTINIRNKTKEGEKGILKLSNLSAPCCDYPMTF